MKHQFYEAAELPVKEFEKIGLVSRGEISLEEKDMQALLEGRRTGQLRLQNLKMGDEEIAELDSKVSLIRNNSGQLELLIHPIYKEVAKPEYLTDVEAEKLQNGETVSILKRIKDKQGLDQEILVEFDKETMEFVITDTEKIMVPHAVNSEPLTAAQKDAFKKGKEVTLSDDTIFKYSGTDRRSMRANKFALIASIVFDGGMSYMLYKGLRSLSGQKQSATADLAYSAGYKKAVEELSVKITPDQKDKVLNEINHEAELNNKEIPFKRGYPR